MDFSRRLRDVAVSAALAGMLLAGCVGRAAEAGSAGVGAARLDIDGDRIALEVLSCGLIAGRFTERVPEGRSETTLTAIGTTSAGDAVSVLVRRTRDVVAPHRIQTVEIAVGDPEVAVRSLVLYRGLDEATGTWTAIDPRAADPRVPVPGPLIDLHDASLRAEGTAWLPEDGRPILVRLDARCPVEVDGTSNIA